MRHNVSRSPRTPGARPKRSWWLKKPRQRKAIIEGLQVSIEQFQKVVEGASAKEVMQLVMVTQYFDTLKSIGESDRTNTLFLAHSPGTVNEISDQIMQSMLVANRSNG